MPDFGEPAGAAATGGQLTGDLRLGRRVRLVDVQRQALRGLQDGLVGAVDMGAGGLDGDAVLCAGASS